MNFIKSLFLVLLFAPTTWAAESLVNVKSLNQNLEKENAAWVAKENWMTRLPKEELQRMMGAKDVPDDDVDFVAPDDNTKANLPSALDWRNKNGRNWVSPILNQQNCGSCVAFATLGVMETQINISSMLPGLNVQLSAQDLFSCGGGLCDDGWWVLGAIEHLQDKGVTDESCMPYTSGATAKDGACNAKCADSAKRNYKISDWAAPTKYIKSLKAIKTALQHGPVITTLRIYSDFIGYSSGVYSKSKTAQALGGHAVSIVGYDDAKQAFIIRNSWGEEWGQKGFGYVSYDDGVNMGRQTWWIDVASASGSVAMSYPRDYGYVSGTEKFSANSTTAKTDSIQMTVFNAAQKAVWSSSCQGASCGTSFDSTKFPEGRYEVQATSVDTHGSKLRTSSKKFFYIVNQKPEFTLSFKGAPGYDLSKPISDRPDLVVTTKSSSVPLSEVEFYYKDSKGKVMSKRTEVVMDQMWIGWRTTTIPNGTYEIWMVGRMKSSAFDVKTETPHYKVVVKNEPL